MKKLLRSIAPPKSATLPALTGALMLLGCEEFTCEDYATCEIPDSGAPREAGFGVEHDDIGCCNGYVGRSKPHHG